MTVQAAWSTMCHNGVSLDPPVAWDRKAQIGILGDLEGNLEEVLHLKDQERLGDRPRERRKKCAKLWKEDEANPAGEHYLPEITVHVLEG